MASIPPFVRIQAADISVVFDLRDGFVVPVYIGPEITGQQDAEALCDASLRGPHPSQPDRPEPASLLPQHGTGFSGCPAITLLRDGKLLPSRFVLKKVAAGARTVRFEFVDAPAGAALELSWTISESAMIVATVAVRNTGSARLTIGTLAVAVPAPQWATHLVRYVGRWAAEMREERVIVPRGSFGADSFGGRPGFGGANWVCLEEASATESGGRVFAAHLAWSGDTTLLVARDTEGQTMVLIGPRIETGEIAIAPGERFSSPEALIGFSHAGRARLRQIFHGHALSETLPVSVAASPRKVHLNSWEALGFDITLPGLLRLAEDAAALGVERFVLDDGWQKGRRDDSTSLGDWTPDPDRLPGGLVPVIDHVHALGMDFGLWVEPEMVSPDSDLYRVHPDWCLHLADADRPTQRGQLVLDLSRADVADHLFAQIDALLNEYAIAYLKWDHNRDMFPLCGKGHVQTRALYALLDKVRAAHPAVEIETCASGGARVDFEILKRCARFWASDNNDAVERLRINRGWLRFLPLAITGNHVGPSPNPVTGRRLSMDFRAKVAMFGHMGIEANPAAMSARERSTLASVVALYKQWREVLHRGALSAIDFVDPGLWGWLALDGDRGIAIAASTVFSADYNAEPVRLAGLTDEARYRVRLIEPWPARAVSALAKSGRWRDGLVLTGQALREVGLALPLTHPETAWLISLERQP